MRARFDEKPIEYIKHYVKEWSYGTARIMSMRLAAKRSLDESNKEAAEKAAAVALANAPKKRRVAQKYASSHPSLLFVKVNALHALARSTLPTRPHL